MLTDDINILMEDSDLVTDIQTGIERLNKCNNGRCVHKKANYLTILKGWLMMVDKGQESKIDKKKVSSMLAEISKHMK